MRTPTLAAVLASLAWALPLQAQFSSGQPSASTGWAPASIGARVGYDNSQRGWTTGGFVGIPLVRNGIVELMPNFDVTFLPGFDEYQGNLELAYFTGDRRGGIVLGAGMGLRNSPFSADPDAERRNLVTYSVMLGVRLGTLGRFAPQLEARWILQDEWPRDPRQVSLGVGFALWGR